MQLKTLAVASAFAVQALAQRPSDTPICDYYTTALLKENTAANQMTLLTALVNTAVIGTFPIPGVNTTGMVAGILAPGEVDGTEVNLLPYFNGGFASTNRGDKAVSVNFLDGGGADPLKELKPANSTSSNQHMLLTHLYEYFGALLGCSMQGNDEYPAYDGQPSQYEVHKFMALSYIEVSYFNKQVAEAAKSFGVAESDLTAVGTALNTLFNVRCQPETVVIPDQGAQLQSICIDSSCPLSNGTCSAYDDGKEPVEPSVATASLVPSATATGTEGASGGGVEQTQDSMAAFGAEISLLALFAAAFALLMW